jgi:hypothetical protein
MSRSKRARSEGLQRAGGGGPSPGADVRSPLRAAGVRPPRHGRYLGLLAVLLVALIALNTVLTTSHIVRGIEPGKRVPPFALPLATGTVNGDADVATHADSGSAGRTPACAERGAGILNICELYERGPVVLALFVDADSCPAVLSDMQALARRFPGVGFAAVAIKGERGPLRKLIAGRALTSVQVGFDGDGVLAGLYRLLSCPQVTFVLPGGIVQSPPLLSRPALQTLRMRVEALVAAAKAGGWKAQRR